MSRRGVIGLESAWSSQYYRQMTRHLRRIYGIASGAEGEPLADLDRTAAGTHWFDLRTRRPLAAAVKRQLDIIGSATLILILSPFFLLIMLAIWLSSPGPAIFIQRRIGFRCNEFGMYKFRSMVMDGEKLQEEFVANHDRQFFKLENDPRITRLGRLLRRYSLDELPQLFNVLEGTMSLVGPRPLLVSDLQKYPRRGQMRRFSVRPGMTGLWQVSGRSALSDEHRMELDRRYVNEWSLWLDTVILLKTVRVVFSGEGAS